MSDMISVGQVVFVYFNIRRKLFSVRSMNGLVIGHVERIDLADVTFKVSEAGRQRVLRTRVKNVHAGLQGTVATKTNKQSKDAVTYNPYKYDSFVTKRGKKVSSATRVRMTITNKHPLVHTVKD